MILSTSYLLVRTSIIISINYYNYNIYKFNIRNINNFKYYYHIISSTDELQLLNNNSMIVA